VEGMMRDIREGGEELFLANLNAPDQTVVSGTHKAIEQLLELALRRGARKATMLNVAVPSHNTLMLPVAQQLSELCSSIRPKNPRIPCASNATARLFYDGPPILDDLMWSVSRPVRWHDATVTIYEAGASVFLEMPPGQILTRLATAAFPDSRCLAVEDSGINSAMAVTRGK
jgi:malonate decarboxylase epsilon subunit